MVLEMSRCCRGLEYLSHRYLCSQDQSYYSNLGTACALSNVSIDVRVIEESHG